MSPSSAEDSSHGGSESMVPHLPVFDGAVLLEQLGGDATALRELLALYLQEGPRLCEAIRSALAHDSADGVRRSAHALKGTLGSITARQASAAAELLERLGRTNRLSGAATALADLDAQLERLDGELKRWLEPGSEP